MLRFPQRHPVGIEKLRSRRKISRNFDVAPKQFTWQFQTSQNNSSQTRPHIMNSKNNIIGVGAHLQNLKKIKSQKYPYALYHATLLVDWLIGLRYTALLTRRNPTELIAYRGLRIWLEWSIPDSVLKSESKWRLMKIFFDFGEQSYTSWKSWTGKACHFPPFT